MQHARIAVYQVKPGTAIEIASVAQISKLDMHMFVQILCRSFLPGCACLYEFATENLYRNVMFWVYSFLATIRKDVLCTSTTLVA
jgi:hypothetical protein